MADKGQDSARRIVGAVIQSGRIFKAGDEDALAGALPAADVDRLVTAGQLVGEWGPTASTNATDITGADDEDGETEDVEELEGLPSLPNLAEHLATVTDADELKALRKTDKRKGAKPMYAARLAELKDVAGADR